MANIKPGDIIIRLNRNEADALYGAAESLYKIVTDFNDTGTPDDAIAEKEFPGLKTAMEKLKPYKKGK
jgi:hypothetical protein